LEADELSNGGGQPPSCKGPLEPLNDCTGRTVKIPPKEGGEKNTGKFPQTNPAAGTKWVGVRLLKKRRCRFEPPEPKKKDQARRKTDPFVQKRGGGKVMFDREKVRGWKGYPKEVRKPSRIAAQG